MEVLWALLALSLLLQAAGGRWLMQQSGFHALGPVDSQRGTINQFVSASTDDANLPGPWFTGTLLDCS